MMPIYTAIPFTKYWELRNYLFGGKATISIISNKTNTHFTYRVVSASKTAGRYFVWVKVDKKLMFLGTIDAFGKKFFWSPRSSIPQNWKRYKAFLWLWRHVINKNIPKSVYVYRYNNCCVCGRKLTNPKSIKAGIGPECKKNYKGIS